MLSACQLLQCSVLSEDELRWAGSDTDLGNESPVAVPWQSLLLGSPMLLPWTAPEQLLGSSAAFSTLCKQELTFPSLLMS